MGQEFIIKSQTLEDKVNQLLPSQGGFQAGVDLSASTTIIPIVDLTESAEGSNLRQDLQTALSHNDVTAFDHSGSSSTLINTTGFFRIFGCVSALAVSGSTKNGRFELFDGATTKQIVEYKLVANSNGTNVLIPFDFNVFIGAGDSLLVSTTDSNVVIAGCSKQLADINGNLTIPS